MAQNFAPKMEGRSDSLGTEDSGRMSESPQDIRL